MSFKVYSCLEIYHQAHEARNILQNRQNTAEVPNTIWTLSFLIITYLVLFSKRILLVYFTVLIDLLLAIML